MVREVHGPETFTASLEELDIKSRLDELDPVTQDPGDVDLEWVRSDDRLAGTIEAADHGELTPSEALDNVAAALGYDSPLSDDYDDGYDY